MSNLFFRLAASLCFLAVVLGAFGAHTLRSTLELRGTLQTWQTAVLYHFIHAVALLVLALYGASNRGAWWLLFAGVLLNRTGDDHRDRLCRDIFSRSWCGPVPKTPRWCAARPPVSALLFDTGLLRSHRRVRSPCVLAASCRCSSNPIEHGAGCRAD